MAAAPVKLVARIATLLWVILHNNTNTHKPEWKTRGHCSLARSIIFVNSVNFSCGPVSPVNILAIDSQAKRTQDCDDNDLTLRAL